MEHEERIAKITHQQRVEITRQHKQWEEERRIFEAQEAAEQIVFQEQWEKDNWVSLMFSPGHQLTRLGRWLTKLFK